MGNDSSISSNVYSLNDSLGKIEERLFRIEDIHLHHQTCFNIDDSVIISGKKIKCSKSVKVLCGPVLGLVGRDRVSIMLEVDSPTTVTFNIFRSDKFTVGERFVESKSFSISSFTPTVLGIDNLVPGVPYTIYIGGIEGKQTIDRPVRFTTINEKGDNCVFQSIHPGLSEQSTAFEYKRAVESAVNERGMCPTGTSHQLIFLGNSVFVSTTIESHFLNVWESLSGCNGSESWLSSVGDFERSLQSQYRVFFNEPLIMNLATSGSFIPIAGSGESGRTSMERLVENVEHAMAEAESQERSSAVVETSQSEKNPAAGSSGWAARKLRKAQEGSAVKSVTTVHSMSMTVAAEKAELSHRAAVEMTEKCEIQKLLLFLMCSISRSVYSQYFRQLWDSQFAEFHESEKKIQHLLKCVLTLRSKILRYNRMIQQLLQGQKRYMEQFHHNDTATEESVKALQIELQSAKQKVVNYLQAISELGDAQCSWSEPKFLTLGGGFLYIVCDCEWFWMERYLHLKSPLNKPCSIPETSLKKIKEILTDPKDATEQEKSCVVCVLPSVSLDPQMDWLKSLLPMVYEKVTEEASLSLTDKDFSRLLLELSSWQRKLESRSALLLCGGSFSSSNQIYFHVDHEPLDDEPRSFNLSDGMESRDSVCALIAGRVCSAREQLFSFLHQRQWLNYQRRSRPAEFSLDAKKITAFIAPSSSLSSNTYWGVAFKPYHEYSPAHRFASFTRDLIPFADEAASLRGMLLGEVTDHSCSVLLETVEDAVVSLVCEDSLNGMQYHVRQSVRAAQPAVVQFTGLASGHHYHIYQQCGRQPIQQSTSFLSFTTTSKKLQKPFQIFCLYDTSCMERVRSVEANQHSRDSLILLNSLRQSTQHLDKILSFLSWPWNGVDLILHSHVPVDLQLVLPRAVALLQQAEAYLASNNEDRARTLKNQAQEFMQDAVRTTLFSSAVYRDLFHHNAHFLSTISAVDLLRCIGFSGIDVLYREVSPPVADQLLALVDKVSADYCRAPWHGSRQEATGVVVNESIFLFELSPEFSFRNRNAGCISPKQLDCLQDGLRNTAIRTLLILSQLPIIERDSVIPSSERTGPFLHEKEVVSLLDVCHAWLLNGKAQGKSIVFLCPGSSGDVDPAWVEIEVSDKGSSEQPAKPRMFQQVANIGKATEKKKPWEIRLQSKSHPFAFYRCHSGFQTPIAFDNKASEQELSSPFGCVINIDESVEILRLDTKYVEDALVRHVTSDIVAPIEVSETFVTATSILQMLYGSNSHSGSSQSDHIPNDVLVELGQYKDILDDLLSRENAVLSTVFQAFSGGDYCDTSSRETSRLFEAFLQVCRDILDRINPVVKEFVGYPSIIGVQMAWNVLLSMQGQQVPPSMSFPVLCTRQDVFLLFIRVVFLSRIILDWTSRDSRTVD